MKIARIGLLAALGMFLVALQAQAQCNWDQTQSGKITETCGSVGIGTTSPAATLHVTSPTSDKVEIQLAAGPGAAPGTRLRFVGDRMWTLGTLEFNPGKFTLWDPTSSAYRMVFDPTAGVAFGTNTPWGGLHVFGTGQTANNPTVTSTSQALNGSTLFLQDSANAPGNGGMLVFGAASGFFAGLKGSITDGAGNTTGILSFLTRGSAADATLTERMRIMPSGSILIGPASWDNNAKLHIAESDPAKMWTFVTDHVANITSNGTHYIWPAAIRSWENVSAGVAETGTAGGIYLEAYNTGNGALAATSGIDVNIGVNNQQGGTGTVTTATGLTVNMRGAVSNGFGVLVQDLSATSAWGIFQVGTNDQNFFAGRVAIGTTSPDPTTMLHVNGNAKFTGTVTGGNIQATYQDVAEWVPSRNDLRAGTVVVLDETVANTVMESTKSYDTTVAGVVSAQPGITLGVPDANKEQIATTGRVKVRVDATRAPIRIGDLLVTSDKPGMAMKSQTVEVSGITLHRPGTIIGKALEPLASGEGEILVLLSLQ